MRVGIFVDGANMFYAQRDNGWHIDYKRLYDFFGRGKEITVAYYFTGAPPFDRTETVRKHRSFTRALIMIGFTVVEKEAKTLTDRETGEKIDKADLDVEIVLGVVSSMPLFDEAIILAGDGDYAALVNYVRNNGKSVTCVARRESTALELINAANHFIELNSIREHIEKGKE